jgi:glycosyltransferase involved in cell wall biosynthesis
MASEVDHVVAVCNWVRDLLLRNGVEAKKLLLSRQGIDWPETDAVEQPRGHVSGTVRIVFVGRLDPTKGLDVILDVLRTMPDLKVALDVYGVVQGPANAAYREAMLFKSAGDGRIAFKEPLAANEVVSQLRQYDFIIVPSMWLETGPMVVLEAFAAGVPVLGWGIGGIGELVRDGVDGMLVEPFSIEGWMNLLRRVAHDRQLHAQLKAGIREPRRIIDVALEMKELYQRLRIGSLH